MPAAVQRRIERHVHLFTDKTLIIGFFFERAIDAGRGHLKRIGLFDDVCGIQIPSQVFRNRGAVIQRDTALLIQVEAQDPLAVLVHKHGVHQLRPVFGQHRRRDLFDLFH